MSIRLDQVPRLFLHTEINSGVRTLPDNCLKFSGPKGGKDEDLNNLPKLSKSVRKVISEIAFMATQLAVKDVKSLII